jgi:putative transposase
MHMALAAHDELCDAVIWILLRLAVSVDGYRRWAHRRAGKLRGSLRRLRRQWLHRRGRRLPGRPGKAAHNRTPEHVEELVVRLHVEQPQLGAGQLMRLSERVLGFVASRETIRRILLRRRELVVEMQEECRRHRRRIRVQRRGILWGADLTVVWLLGFWPVWVLGVVDYHGSRVIAFERVPRASSRAMVQVIEAAMQEHGAPERLLTDRGGQFVSLEFEGMCAGRGVRHVLIRPAHAWTNGRIERVFQTFKETVRHHLWLFASRAQIERWCSDFLQWHNRDRPHQSFGGRTPDEVFFGRAKQKRALGRVDYFDGALRWYRFGPAG